MLKLTDALRKAAAKCTVRESDEESPGRFVAYVDEGTESYDVALELDADRNPLSGRCDCDAKKPCRHMAALFLFVNEGKKLTTKVAPNKVKKKKQTPAEALLETVDNVALREWVASVVLRNKELELAFTTRFRPADAIMSAADVTRISEDAVKSILGRARYVDPSQLKRIIKLWKELHKPIVERYRAAPAEQSAFDAVHAIVDVSIKLADYHHGGVQAVRYAEEMLFGLGPVVALLQQDEAFQRACGFFLAKNFTITSRQLPVYLAFVAGVVDGLARDRLVWLARQVALGLQEIEAGRREQYNWHVAEALHLVTKAGIFAEFVDIFPRLPGNDRYNLALLEALLAAGRERRALDLGWAMFKSARHETPVELFLTPLADAAVKLGDRDAELKIRQELFQRTFRQEDFKAIVEAAGDQKRVEKKLISQAANSSRIEAGSFLAELYAARGNWKALADEVMRGKVLYSVIGEYFEAMYKSSPELLLKALVDGASPRGAFDVAREQRAMEAVLQQALDAFGRDRIASVVNGDRAKRVGVYYYNVLRQSMIKTVASQ